MNRFFLFIPVFFVCTAAFAQNNAIYNQFNFNPYIYNPAFVGYSDATQVNTAFRRQWADVEDSPTSAVLSFEHPFNSRVSVGLMINHDQAIVLQRNSVLLTYGYKIRFSGSQFLSFGISGGVGRFGLDSEGIDLSDPSIANAISSSYYADGNVGILYANSRFDLSVGLNNIFDTNPYSGQNFESIQLSGLDNIFVSFRYRLSFANPDLKLLPYIFYQHLDVEFDQLEGGALLSIRDKFILGGSYRYKGMPAAIVGFNLFENLSASYSYEFGPSEFSSFQGGSHEVMFRFRFNRKSKGAKQLVEEPEIQERIEEEIVDTAIEKEKDSTVKSESKAVSTKPTINQTEKMLETPKDAKAKASEKKVDEPSKINGVPKPQLDKSMLQANQGMLEKGYYVIFGVFEFEENAKRFIEDASANGFNFYYAQNTQNQYYYVFKEKFSTQVEAKILKDKFDKIANYQDSWIFFYE